MQQLVKTSQWYCSTVVLSSLLRFRVKKFTEWIKLFNSFIPMYCIRYHPKCLFQLLPSVATNISWELRIAFQSVNDVWFFNVEISIQAVCVFILFHICERYPSFWLVYSHTHICVLVLIWSLNFLFYHLHVLILSPTWCPCPVSSVPAVPACDVVQDSWRCK